MMQWSARVMKGGLREWRITRSRRRNKLYYSEKKTPRNRPWSLESPRKKKKKARKNGWRFVGYMGWWGRSHENLGGYLRHSSLSSGVRGCPAPRWWVDSINSTHTHTRARACTHTERTTRQQFSQHPTEYKPKKTRNTHRTLVSQHASKQQLKFFKKKTIKKKKTLQPTNERTNGRTDERKGKKKKKKTNNTRTNERTNETKRNKTHTRTHEHNSTTQRRL